MTEANPGLTYVISIQPTGEVEVDADALATHVVAVHRPIRLQRPWTWISNTERSLVNGNLFNMFDLNSFKSILRFFVLSFYSFKCCIIFFASVFPVLFILNDLINYLCN